jgi:hypothetical protein
MGTCGFQKISICFSEHTRSSLPSTQETHLGQAGKINEGEIQNTRRKYLQIYWLSVDAFVGTSDPCRLTLYLTLDIAEVVEPSVRYVMEFCPFRASGGTV